MVPFSPSATPKTPVNTQYKEKNTALWKVRVSIDLLLLRGGLVLPFVATKATSQESGEYATYIWGAGFLRRVLVSRVPAHIVLLPYSVATKWAQAVVRWLR